MRSFFIVASLAVIGFPMPAQQPASQPMGTVATRDALVTGGLEVGGERACLLANASVTAYDHTAAIDLTRGGEVLVCATSQFHLLRSGVGNSLQFGLDRGAVEIHTPAEPQDVVLTPDLRFTFATPGKLDLRIRVTPNGDTCVDNEGAAAPVIDVSDAFSDDSYRLAAGQHVLFEQGSLREVVDSESSSCGCPAAAALPADVVAATAGAAATPADVAAQHPFPAAVSQGLAPAQPVANNSAPNGEARTQVSTTLTFGAEQPGSPSASAPPPVPAVAAAPVSTEPPPSPPGPRDLAHIIGGFFHRLFHRRH